MMSIKISTKRTGAAPIVIFAKEKKMEKNRLTAASDLISIAALKQPQMTQTDLGSYQAMVRDVSGLGKWDARQDPLFAELLKPDATEQMADLQPWMHPDAVHQYLRLKQGIPLLADVRHVFLWLLQVSCDLIVRRVAAGR